MQLRNTSSRYGALAQLFHWIIVALIIVQFTLAKIADDLPRGGLRQFKVLFYHKSVGITILTLATLRLLWRWTGTTPSLPNTLRPFEVKLARITHALLYALLFAMPLSGWIMSNAENFPVSYFGWFVLPNLVQPNKGFGEIMDQTHAVLFEVLLSVTLLHVAAALKHHFWHKDDVLKRMLPFTTTRPRGPSP
jgi:cytochrome b561